MTFERGSSQETRSIEKYLSELGWREFSYHLLYHFPLLPDQNWRSEFDAYPWRVSEADLAAWQRGETGYPLVTGMRQLWRTGWMHNRVRMIAASFLTSICESIGGMGKAGFGTPFSMPIWRTTQAGGNGFAGRGDAQLSLRFFRKALELATARVQDH